MSKQPLQDLISPARLKTFLNEAPLLFGAHLSAEDKELVLTNCYRSLWSNDLESQQKYFFSESEDNLTQLLKKYHLLKSDSDQEEEEPEYFETERGKQCGHLFKKGESVYRCR
jgi:hypothetical protein